MIFIFPVKINRVNFIVMGIKSVANNIEFFGSPKKYCPEDTIGNIKAKI